MARVAEQIDVEVMATASRPRDALAAVEENRPAVFVTDLDTGDASLAGTECIRRARAIDPKLRTIVLSAWDDPVHINEAFAAGGVAYVVKTSHPDDIAATIRQAFDNSVFFSPPAVPATSPVDTPRGAEDLTRRELEILRLAADGNSNAQMARTLWVTEQTVKFHLSNIYRKLNVSNRTEASRWAQLHGVLTMPESLASAREHA